MDEQIYQHFRSDESEIIDEINDDISQVADQYRPVLTGFLNPRQVYIAQTLINRQDEIKFRSFGGYDSAELQRLLIYPGYYEPEQSDFEIVILQIKYPTKFAQLHHRDILGALTSQGIERNTFGDILTDGEEWQVVVDQKMADFFMLNVTKIANVNVQLVETDLEAVLQPASDWETKQTTVSSLRIDIVVAAAFNYSRNRAKILVETGNVRLNWVDEVRPDYPIRLHDLISVRHGGRIRLSEIDGVTKKDKIRVTLETVTAK